MCVKVSTVSPHADWAGLSRVAMSASNLSQRRWWSSTQGQPFIVVVDSSWLHYWRECFFKGMEKEERCRQLLLNIFIKTHWTNTQNTNKKMTIHFFLQLAVQHRRHASLKWTVFMEASHAVKVPFLIGWGFFFLFLHKAFEAILISMYIHCQHVFFFLLLDWRFSLYWTLHSYWLQFDWIHLRFWCHDHLPILGEKKPFFPFLRLD